MVIAGNEVREKSVTVLLHYLFIDDLYEVVELIICADCKDIRQTVDQ